MKRLRGILGLLLTALFLAGCAATVPTAEQKDVGAGPPMSAEERTPPRLVEDHDFFNEGVALLNHPKQPDPAKARTFFTSMIQRYPQSRWRPAAETLIRLLDEGEAARNTARQAQLLNENLLSERAKILHEHDQLKKTVRELTEKLQTETASVARENEQLKKDLQRLKTLEIELEKRERMLR